MESGPCKMAAGDAEESPPVAQQTTAQRMKAFFGGAAFKTGCFVCVIILIAVLSATVLQKPIAEGSAWVRQSGVGGYFLLASIGYAFLVLGGSSSLFDVICGYIYGGVNGLIVSWVVKVLAACTCYALSRFLFHAYLRKHLFAKYVYLEALELMMRERPWQTVTILRLSVLPAAIKSYGMGALAAPFLPFITTAMLTFAVLSWVLADLGSRISKPSEVLTAKSKGSMALEAVGIGFALLMVGFGAYYGRKYTKDIMDKRAEEASAMGLEGGEGANGPTGSKVAPGGEMEMRPNGAT